MQQPDSLMEFQIQVKTAVDQNIDDFFFLLMVTVVCQCFVHFDHRPFERLLMLLFILHTPCHDTKLQNINVLWIESPEGWSKSMSKSAIWAGQFDLRP
jgi:hypothetical protein